MHFIGHCSINIPVMKILISTGGAKDEIADWIAEKFFDGSRVLSVGCGLGQIEQRLWRLHGDRIELHVLDYATEALRWLGHVMPPSRIHVVGESDSSSICYDFIYFSAVDYALSDEKLLDLLITQRKSLQEGGAVMLLSASFFEESKQEKLNRFVNLCKEPVKWVLERFGVYKRSAKGQLWGWLRSRNDYRTIMSAAGFVSVSDGFIETPYQRTYWIKGKGVKQV